MTDLETKEIKGINLKMLVTFVIGTVTVCSTVVWGVAEIKSTMQQNTYRIDQLERWQEKTDDKLEKLYTYRPSRYKASSR